MIKRLFSALMIDKLVLAKWEDVARFYLMIAFNIIMLAVIVYLFKWFLSILY